MGTGRLCFLFFAFSMLITFVIQAQPGGTSSQIVVPWLDSNYMVRQVETNEDPRGWTRLDFNLSGFSQRPAGFGTRGGTCTYNSPQYVRTNWDPNHDLLLRRSFILPSNVNSLTITIAVDNAAQVWVNETQISSMMFSNGCPSRTPPKAIVLHATNLRPGQANLIAVRARDTGGETYFDMQVVSDSGGGGGTVTLLNYLSGGYHYKSVPRDSEQGFQNPGFVEHWRIGTAGFGNWVGTCSLNTPAYAKTAWPSGTNMLLRKNVFVPGGSTNVVLEAAVDNGIQVYVNGIDISGGMRSRNGCPSRGNFRFSVPDNVLNKGANNLIAVRGRDTGGANYLDVKITAGGGGGGTGQIVVPWLDSNYMVRQVDTGDDPRGWTRLDFNLSGFSQRPAGFGTKGGTCTYNSSSYVHTNWDPNHDLLLRRSFILPSNARSLTITIAVDNAAQVWVNETQISSMISSNGCPSRTPPKAIVLQATNLRPGQANLIAVRARDNGGESYFDMQVTRNTGAGVPLTFMDNLSPDYLCGFEGQGESRTGIPWFAIGYESR